MTSGRTNEWTRVREGRRTSDTYPPAKADRGKTISAEHLWPWLTVDANKKRLEDHLDRYLSCYSGRLFEFFLGQHSDPLFTPWDILAVESLSVSVPAEQVRWLLFDDNPGANERDSLLRELHEQLVLRKRCLWTCEPSLLEAGGALDTLYFAIKARKGIGSVKASKLLASKFPAVVPIRDKRIASLIELGDSEDWWSRCRDLLLADGGSLIAYLDQLRIPEGSGPITTLRRLDIVLWMEAIARDLGT